LALSLAPEAQASKGVYDAFGLTGSLGGSFAQGNSLVGAAAVNSTGTGGAGAGDAYIADRGNNRIQRFDADGNFVSAWGQDVVKAGAAEDTGTGFELCAVAANCKAGSVAASGGAMGDPRGVAVDQQSGNVYVADKLNNRIDEFSATGTFIRAFGKDVVQTGQPGDNPSASAKQTLTVSAGGGKYTLEFEGQKTGELSFAATSTEIQSALLALPRVGAGNVEVTGAASPFTIAFKGAHANNPEPDIAVISGPGEPLTGGTATIATTTPGSNGFEICAAAQAAGCKAGGEGATAGAFNSVGAEATSLAIAPAGAPNAGDVLVADAASLRVQEFTSSGAFVRAFGWGVAAAGPGNTAALQQNQSVTVKATAGTFTLAFNGQPTAPLQFNATVAEVQTALNGLSTIGGSGGTATVWGGPGNSSGSAPYFITLGGTLGGASTDPLLIADASGLTVGTKTATVAAVPGFQVCSAAAFDACKSGVGGAGIGQFGAARRGPSTLAEDSSGTLYTVESLANFRVQRLTLTASSVTPHGSFDPGELSGTSAPTTKGSGDSPISVAVDTSTAPGTPGTVYVLKSFATGTGTPPARRKEARILEVDPAANSGAGAVTDTFAAQAEIGSEINSEIEPATDLALNTSTHRLYVTQPQNSSSVFLSYAYIVDVVPPVMAANVQAGGIGSSTATLEAQVTPAPLPHLHTSYRFEYARAGSAAGPCGSGGTGWTRVPLADADVGNGLSPVQVSQEIDGLKFEASYESCLFAHTKFNGSEVLVNAAPFTTHTTPPGARTGRALWSSPPSTGPSLLLGGTVNPGLARTTYFFQYVSEEQFQASGFEAAAEAPAIPAEAGRGASDVFVHQSIAGLDPAKSYEYRLVASNTVATTIGEAAAVAPPGEGDRFYELVSAGDSDGPGVQAEVGSVSAGGERAMFLAQAFGQPPSLPAPTSNFVSVRGPGGWAPAAMQPRADHASLVNLDGSGTYRASSLETTLWPEYSRPERERAEVQFGYARLDGSHSPASAPIVPLSRAGAFTEYRLRGATPDLSTFVFTPDSQGVTFFAGEPTVTSASFSDLYQVSGAGGPNPVFGLVNRADGKAGAQIGGACGAGLGGSLGAETRSTTHALSDDGSVVYFSARPGEPSSGPCAKAQPKRLFKRVNGETTVEVSASLCTRVSPPCAGSGDDTFNGASADGSVAFFTTARQLANSDEDSGGGCTTSIPAAEGCDLYLYDETPPAGQPKLVQASAGETVGAHSAGKGAKVLGVLDSSADGSRVYFAAEGVLAANSNSAGRSAEANKPNLYVYERDEAHPSGRLAFLGTLDPVARINSGGSSIADSLMWSPSGSQERKEASALPVAGDAGDGRYLLFTSFAKLVSADSDDAKDLYRYDDQSGQLVCLTCAGNGPFHVFLTDRPTNARSDYAEATSTASADVSTVIFTTAEALLPADENQGQNPDCNDSIDVHGCDVYAWQAPGVEGCAESTATPSRAYLAADGGCLSLITGGTEALSVAAARAAVSLDGRNVFFVTRAQLVAADTNNADDLYDARVGGGFPARPAAASCAGSEQCQGSGSGGPGAAPSSPGSATFSGPGNEAAPRPCPKGKVRKHGKCLKKGSRQRKSSKHRGRPQHRDPNNQRRAAR
jgi:hypothetical protein